MDDIALVRAYFGGVSEGDYFPKGKRQGIYIPDKEAKQKVEDILLSEHYWKCWNCSEQNHNDFFDCWKCHKPKQKPSFVRTIKSPPKPRPTSLQAIKEAVKKAPPKRITAQSLRNKTYKG